MINIEGKTAELLEWDYISSKVYSDPFNDIVLDIIITSPQGIEWKIPAFWRGEIRWSVRFICEEIGTYNVTTVCSDKKNKNLHHVESSLFITKNTQKIVKNLKISTDKNHIVDEKNNPFFWFSDTWWMALSARLSYPNDFKILTEKRVSQGINVIMLVAGLMPDMDSFDIRASNECGLPWEKEYARINPNYFDKADERIEYLIKSNLIPCIVGAWGYYLLLMGEKKMKQHWRYIIARWGAYPVVWCVAGEATMPFYLSTQRKKDTRLLNKGWLSLSCYIKEIEPFNRLITIHSSETIKKGLTDNIYIDFHLIQSGHTGYTTVSAIPKLFKKKKHIKMPLIVGESNYEGIIRDTHSDMQRLTFWTAILSGAKGYSYGANGIWQINTLESTFGASPHGATWGDTPWKESYLYQGVVHLALAKKLLEQYQWWKLKPDDECIYPYQNNKNPSAIRVASIEKQLRIIYFYSPVVPWQRFKYKVLNLYPFAKYEVYFWNPTTTKRHFIGIIKTKKDGSWKIPPCPTLEDWILIIEVVSKTNIQELRQDVKCKIVTYCNIKLALKKILFSQKVISNLSKIYFLVKIRNKK